VQVSKVLLGLKGSLGKQVSQEQQAQVSKVSLGLKESKVSQVSKEQPE
jgi:hypothetical protein